MEYYIVTLVTVAAIETILVLGFNIQFGFAGVLNFSYITFVAIGAYTTAVTTLGSHQTQTFPQSYILGLSLPWPVALLVSGAVCVVAALLLSFLVMQRLRSDYLAISLIGVGEIIWTVAGNQTSLVNGWTGLANIPRPYSNLGIASGGLAGDLVFMAIGIVVAVGTFFAASRLYKSPLGRVLRAVREDGVIAETFGRRVLAARLTAFCIGSFIAGVGGGLLAMNTGAYNPNAFLPLETFLILAALIVGGTSSPFGAVVGAIVVFIVISEGTRYLPSSLNPDLVGGLRQATIGLLLIVTLRFRPQGLFPEPNLRLYRRLRSRMALARPLAPPAPGPVGVGDSR